MNTVDWTDRGLTNERLTDYERLTRWAEGAGVLSRSEGRRLRERARAEPEAAAAAHEEALRLRALLQRLYGSVAAGERRGAPWDELNQELTAALARLRVAPSPGGGRSRRAASWEWSGAQERLASMLWPVLRSAAELLTSEESRRIRLCAGPDCGWMYVDRSRNRMRRWCQMETCGTAAKTRRRRERRLASRRRKP